jgi:ArsR family transcriptional regulator, arsenate/arsenite/antimonite-responsive transcriptional repressor
MDIFLKQTKALADGGRLRIVAALSRYPELCVCQITELLGLATATVSRHISILQNAGLVKSRKDGRWVFYRLADDFPEELMLWINNNLMSSEQIKDDSVKLDTIVSCDVEKICRKTKI